MEKVESETTVAILAEQFEGLIIQKEDREQIIFVNDLVKQLLNIPKDSDDVMNRITETQFEEIGRSGIKYANETFQLL